MMLRAAAFALLLLLAACSKVTQQNFGKIRDGMTEEEVQSILGLPAATSRVDVGGFSGTSLSWRSGDAEITVRFLNGKAVLKSFSLSAPGK